MPVTSNMIKIIDIPEMNCFVNLNGKGQVCIKGFNVFKGYYKEPEKTAETLSSDGWLYTGDVGTWNEVSSLGLII